MLRVYMYVFSSVRVYVFVRSYGSVYAYLCVYVCRRYLDMCMSESVRAWRVTIITQLINSEVRNIARQNKKVLTLLRSPTGCERVRAWLCVSRLCVIVFVPEDNYFNEQPSQTINQSICYVNIMRGCF